MLQSLQIKNFILIEKLELDFNEGFCVITGETGAGKSVLLDSILFCLGGKLSSDPVRPSADSCSVTLVFDSDPKLMVYLEEIGIEDVSESLIVKCTQNTQGRKKFVVNDQVVTSKLVQGLFDRLLELHGQHHHTTLLNTASHAEILDEFGKLNQLKAEVARSYGLWREIEHKIKEFVSKKEQIIQDIEYLQHICSELESAQVQKGEEQELADIKRSLQSQGKEKELVQTLLAAIEESAIERLIAKAQKSIAGSDNHQLMEKVSTNLESAYDKIEDTKTILKQILSDIDSPEFSLEEIEDRLYEIRTLTRKHTCHPDELGDFLERSLGQLSSLENQVKNSSELEQQLIQAKQSYFALANELSLKRQKAGNVLAEKVMQELTSLDMKKAIFKVEVNPSEDFASPKGVDKVRFVASTNPGMSLSAIDKIASGGELSRFMLALRVALFDNAPKQTIIFDEIDVGISGSVADSMGERLKALSRAVQIIVITHQPQVAGKADQHILVAKTQHDKHTVAKVKVLNAEERSYELARMISGKEITEIGIKAAKELIM
ncbi:MAG: DNA repair protein RecN [Rickettsiaceae bacterium]